MKNTDDIISHLKTYELIHFSALQMSKKNPELFGARQFIRLMVNVLVNNVMGILTA